MYIHFIIFVTFFPHIHALHIPGQLFCFTKHYKQESNLSITIPFDIPCERLQSYKLSTMKLCVRCRQYPSVLNYLFDIVGSQTHVYVWTNRKTRHCLWVYLVFTYRLDISLNMWMIIGISSLSFIYLML